MIEKTALVYNPEIKNYSFGKGHPFTGERFEIFLKFLKEKLPNFKDYFEEILPEPATEEDLRLFHSQEYIEAMKRASEGEISPNIFQYATVDNLDPSTGYLPRGIEKATRVLVGTTLTAAKLVFDGSFKKAISIGGGLHHAKKSFGEGFCVYNDVVICAKNLLNRGLKRILILDTDAHAGNGTKEAFYEDGGTLSVPNYHAKRGRVLFIDIHQDPKTLYPGTGFAEEIGKGRGEGFIVNIPLPPGASDFAYQYCFEKIIFPLAEEFKPEIVIRNGGSDPHFQDQLTNLGLTLEGFKMIGENVRKLAEICDGKEIDLIASGYNLKILPFAWTALLTGLLDLPIDEKIFKEKISPQKNSGLKETKEIIEKLKEILKKYWKCFK
jgi:acetoin utilization protein AcuC